LYSAAAVESFQTTAGYRQRRWTIKMIKKKTANPTLSMICVIIIVGVQLTCAEWHFFSSVWRRSKSSLYKRNITSYSGFGYRLSESGCVFGYSIMGMKKIKETHCWVFTSILCVFLCLSNVNNNSNNKKKKTYREFYLLSRVYLFIDHVSVIFMLNFRNSVLNNY